MTEKQAATDAYTFDCDTIAMLISACYDGLRDDEEIVHSDDVIFARLMQSHSRLTLSFTCILSCAECLRLLLTTLITVFSAIAINQGLRIEPQVQVEDAVDSSLQGFEFARNHLNKTGSALAVSRTNSLHVKSCFQFCFFSSIHRRLTRQFSKASERLLNETKNFAVGSLNVALLIDLVV